MFRRNRELWYALIGAVVVSAVYGVAIAQAGAFPRASGLVGHGIGILGFVLMLMTETLYSIRKRMTDARWGSMAGWLRFHIVTGLVGSYMVLLHTAVHFRGLAGIAMLLTAVVVVSGVVGRYLYTALPRTLDAEEPVVPEAPVVPATRGDSPAAEQLAARRRAMATWYASHIPLTWVLFTLAFVHAFGALYYATLQR